MAKNRMTKDQKNSIIDTSKMHGINGFTIIELLIATMIFSLVMIGALAGFLQTGRTFYKGVSLTQTQNVTKQVLDDMSNSISATSPNKISSLIAYSGYSYFCAGDVRYTVNTAHTMFDQAAAKNFSANANYGILRDTVSGCAPPCSGTCDTHSVVFNNPEEMLSDHMRVSNFTIAPSSSNKLFSINLTIAYGDDTALAAPNSSSPKCIGGTQLQQFCAVSTLVTSAYSGF